MKNTDYNGHAHQITPEEDYRFQQNDVISITNVAATQLNNSITKLHPAEPRQAQVRLLSSESVDSYQLPPGSNQMGPADAPTAPRDARFVGRYDGITVKGWQRLKRRAHARELMYQGLNIADVALTCVILSRGGRELNPIYGKNASCGTIAAFKGGLGLLHWLIARRRIEVDPAGSTKAINIGMIIQGLAVGWNLTQVAH